MARIATKRTARWIEANKLSIEFEDGQRRAWKLPNRSDTAAIKRLRTELVSWARENGATYPGQTNAIIKTLTQAGFYTVGPKRSA